MQLTKLHGFVQIAGSFPTKVQDQFGPQSVQEASYSLYYGMESGISSAYILIIKIQEIVPFGKSRLRPSYILIFKIMSKSSSIQGGERHNEKKEGVNYRLRYRWTRNCDLSAAGRIRTAHL
jgi:hypothetical protein